MPTEPPALRSPEESETAPLREDGGWMPIAERLRLWWTSPALRRRAPAILLAVVIALSVGSRAYRLDTPTESTPGSGMIFDEKYYVNAARVIAGVPMHPTETYATASPRGTDPNAEHPQLGKVIIAATIRAFGDNPVGWRISAVLFGTAALLLLFWVVRCLNGSEWLALGTVAIAAADNLWLVSGRIAVLDIFCVPFMLAGVGFYLKRRPLLAGALIGIGMCIKEFALYAIFAILLLEALRGIRHLLAHSSVDWRRLARPALTVAATVAVFASLLAVLDVAVRPYHDGHRVDQHQAAICDHLLIWSGACNHVAFMNSYAAGLRSPNGPEGIASYPWQFWANVQPIDYFTTRTTITVGGTVTAVDTTIAFRGEIQPVILVTAWLAIACAVGTAIRRRDDMSFFIVAWIVATWLPAELSSLIGQRTTYLYYMVVTMPALYLAVARMLGDRRIPRWLVGVWVGLLLAGFAILYPFRTFL
ncbi:MAG TPA: phospholipid carrier-dependent glycosyltransferase [Candidatus Angelobacter sp.]|nr:phospholipid carrier-dependent glycosyltransferase [Candidatus Angelobacter sp.]